MVCEEIAVLVRLASPPPFSESSRVGLDLVVVLNPGRCQDTSDDRLKMMKQAMLFVINNLGTDDRLSIVTFNSQVHRCTELSVMSDMNREGARSKISKLKACNHIGLKKKAGNNSKKKAGNNGSNIFMAIEEAAMVCKYNPPTYWNLA